MEPFSLKLMDPSYQHKYICEKTKEVFSLLKKVVLFLNIINLLLILVLYFKLTEILTNRVVQLALIAQIIYGLVGVVLLLIEKYKYILGDRWDEEILRVPCYIFGILIPCLYSLIIFLADNPFFLSSGAFWQCLNFHLTAKVLLSWRANLLINIFPISLTYFCIYKYYLANQDINGYDILTFMYSGAIIFSIFSSYYSEKWNRETFCMKEKLIHEEERIRNFFDMIPANLIKMNIRTKSTQLNTKAHNMLIEYDTTFKDFANYSISRNPNQKTLWERLSGRINLLGRYKGKSSSFNKDLVKIEDFYYTYKKGLKTKKVDFEVRFSQQESNPDEILIILEKKNQERRLKEEKLANIYKNNLIQCISHDLKTPLNGIITLLNEYPPEDKMKNNFKIIIMSAQFLLYKIKDMLDYSQIETGAFVLKEEFFYISVLFSSIINLCDPQARLEKVRIYQKIDPKLLNLIYGDKDKIEQILIHLVQNAIKYTPKNKKVLIEATKVPEGLRFGVKDMGIGISPENIKRIFMRNPSELKKYPSTLEKIRKLTLEKEEVKEEIKKSSAKDRASVEKSTKFNFLAIKFHGVGLQITHQLVMSLNSKLKVLSQQGKGAHFYFILTRYNDDKRIIKDDLDLGSNTKIPKSQKSTHRSLIELKDLAEIDEVIEENTFIEKKMKHYSSSVNHLIYPQFSNKPKAQRTALVVDDNGVNRLAISLLLRAEGIKIIEKADGVEAVQELRRQITKFEEGGRDKKELVDYIFMDLNMPNMDGIEATTRITRMLNKIHISIPIFALTAYDTHQVKTECLLNGFAQFIVKPMKREELKRVLEQYTKI